MNNNNILLQIRAAFPAAPIRFEGALTGGLDQDAFRSHVENKTWRELDRSYLAKRSDALSFLQPNHLAEVLPAYLESLVEDGTRTPVPDTLLLVLNRKSEQRFTEIFAALTASQRIAIVAALDAFASAETGPSADAAREVSERWKRAGVVQ